MVMSTKTTRVSTLVYNNIISNDIIIAYKYNNNNYFCNKHQFFFAELTPNDFLITFVRIKVA